MNEYKRAAAKSQLTWFKGLLEGTALDVVSIDHDGNAVLAGLVDSEGHSGHISIAWLLAAQVNCCGNLGILVQDLHQHIVCR